VVGTYPYRCYYLAGKQPFSFCHVLRTIGQGPL